MDRQALIADLKLAQGLVFEAGIHILRMVEQLELGHPCPPLARASAAQELNRATELIRRAYEG